VSVVKQQYEDSMYEKSEEDTTIETEAGRQASAPAPEELKKLELKPLPTNLRYEFLDPEETNPIIINASLVEKQTSKLLEALKSIRVR
jgi:hypothetical protein